MTATILALLSLVRSEALDGSEPTLLAILLCLGCILERALYGLSKMRPMLPERRRLIGRDRLTTNGLRGVAEFGFLMGLGWWVYIPSAAPYCLALLCVLAPPGPGWFVGVAAGFAMGRALPLVVASIRPEPGDRARVLQQLEHLSTVGVGTGAALLVMVLALALN